MEFKIFDVEHGFFMLMIADNNKVIVLECGHNSTTGLTPTKYLQKLGISIIDELWISNFDEDHISNLAELEENIHIKSIIVNDSISPNDLKRIKESNGRISPNMKTLLRMLSNYTETSVNPPIYPGFKKKIYFNPYPQFQDTNNLSSVFFFRYRDLSFVYAGDLEEKGWENLLKRQDFKSDLKDVNIFIASHHGRESGYNPDIFKYCKPAIIIISDKEIVHDTQIHDYSKHANGIIFDKEERYVLSTRKDGRISFKQTMFTKATINIQ